MLVSLGLAIGIGVNMLGIFISLCMLLRGIARAVGDDRLGGRFLCFLVVALIGPIVIVLVATKAVQADMPALLGGLILGSCIFYFVVPIWFAWLLSSLRTRIPRSTV